MTISACRVFQHEIDSYATFDKSSTAECGYRLVSDNGGAIKTSQSLTEIITVIPVPILVLGKHTLEFIRDLDSIVGDPNRPEKIFVTIIAVEGKEYRLSKIRDEHYEITEQQKNSNQRIYSIANPVHSE